MVKKSSTEDWREKRWEVSVEKNTLECSTVSDGLLWYSTLQNRLHPGHLAESLRGVSGDIGASLPSALYAFSYDLPRFSREQPCDQVGRIAVPAHLEAEATT